MPSFVRTPAVWAAGVVVVVVAGVLVALSQSGGTGDAPAGATTQSSDAGPTAGADPSPEPIPEPIPAEPTTPPAAPAGGGSASPATVAVTVTVAGWLDGRAEASGYAELVEDGGTCVLTLTQGARTVTTTTTAAADATTTSCGTLSVPGADLGPGTWTGTLRYESPRSAGESAPFTIEVPR